MTGSPAATAALDGRLLLPRARAPRPAPAPDPRAAVELYLEALRARDVGRLRRALHPRVKVVYLRADGRARQLTRGEWLRQFETRPAPAGEVLLAAAALGIRQSGDRAVARIERRYAGGVYAEWLWLRRLGREWSVVANVTRWEDGADA